MKLDQSYQKIAIELGLLDAVDAADVVISRNVLMQWLSNPHAQSSTSVEFFPGTKDIYWLLVLDNADELVHLQDYWPIGSNGSILITSRDPLAKSFRQGTGEDVQCFGSTDAAALLNKISENNDSAPTEKKALDSLTLRLGGLPLIIVQVARIIKRQANTYEEFLEILKGESAFMDLKSHEPRQDEDTFNSLLLALWAVEDLTPQVICLLELYSVLDPDGIPDSLLTFEIANDLGTPKFQLEDFPKTNLSYYEARTELWKSSLIVRSKKLQQLSLHRLTQDVVRARMSDDRLQDTFCLALQLLSQAWTEGAEWMTHKKTTWDLIVKLVPHVLKLYSIYKARPASVTMQTERELAKLVQMTGWYLYERGSFDSASHNLANALEIFKKYPEDAQEQLADTLVSLSALTKEMNDPSNHLLYAQWHFEVRNQHPSKDILLNGMAYTQLASAYHQVGRNEEAIELARKGWAINITSPEYLGGEYYPFYAMLYEVLPLMVLGRDEEAKGKLINTISWRESKYGIDDTKSFQLGYALHMLGCIESKHDRHIESTKLWQRALVNYRETMGDNYHRTGTVCAKLAQNYARAGQHETASIFFDEAERCHSLLLYFKRELARTKYFKSQFLKSIGSEDALKCFDEATSLFREISPETAKDAELGAQDFADLVFIWSR